MRRAGGALQDAVVVVAGASSGIGRVTARALADRDATIVVASSQVALLQVTVECGDLGGDERFPTNVSDESREQARTCQPLVACRGSRGRSEPPSVAPLSAGQHAETP